MKGTERVFFARGGDGQVVEVQHVERGLACDCTCLGCGGRLVAKQGTKVVWHFAHEQPSDGRSCGESALHLAAKDALKTVSRLWLPSATWSLESLYDSSGRELPVHVFGSKREANVSAVALEVSRSCAEGDVRLDALLTTSAGPVGIEIRVMHAVDDAKMSRLAELKMPVVELDLSQYVDECTTFAQLNVLLARNAPRQLVAGAQVLFANEAAQALQNAKELLAGIDVALAKLTTMTVAEREREVALARNAGINLNACPSCLGSLSWLTRRPEGDDFPTRPFGGTHHRLWQLAALGWLTGLRSGAKFSFSSMFEGIYRALGVASRDDEGRSAEALSQWLDELDLPGFELTYLYNDDHGWGDNWFRWSKTDNHRAAEVLKDERQMGLF
jgi:hypothetical protein